MRTGEEALKRDLSSFQNGPFRLIASMANPQNPKLGVMVYTATDAASVAGIHSLFHGGTACVAGKGTTVLKTGDYRQRNGRWVLQ